MRFDPATGAASGRIAIDAARAETGNGSRDKTMHEQGAGGRDSIPLFVFVPERFEGELPAAGAASSEVKLVGTLSIHGSEHPLTLPARVESDGDHLTATTTFEVPYVEWGMHDPSRPLPARRRRGGGDGGGGRHAGERRRRPGRRRGRPVHQGRRR